MPIRFNDTSTNPDEIFVGTESIEEVYVGTELVWQKLSLPNFRFSDWTGSASVAQDGTISFVNGNAQSVTNTPTQTFGLVGADTVRAVNARVQVPDLPLMYSNANGFVTGTVNATQPQGIFTPIVTITSETQDTSSITINWHVDARNGTISSQTFVYGTSTSYGSAVSVTAGQRSVTISSLDDNTEYFYMITATNEAGTGSARDSHTTDSLPPYNPTVTYTGPALTGRTSGSFSAGQFSVTNGSDPATVTGISGTTTYSTNIGSDGTASAVAGAVSTRGGASSDSYSGPCNLSSTPTNPTQVFSGTTYRTSGTQNGTRSYTERFRDTPYTYMAVAAVTPSDQSIGVVVSYTVPSGYSGAGNTAMRTATINNPGVAGAAAPTSATAPCGTVTASASCTQTVSLGTQASHGITRGCSEASVGTGTLSIDIDEGASPSYIAGMSYTASLSSSSTTTFSGGIPSNANYNWSVSGHGVSASGTGSTISFTIPDNGSTDNIRISLTLSFTGAESSTFIDSASASVPVTNPIHTQNYTFVLGSATGLALSGTVSGTISGTAGSPFSVSASVIAASGYMTPVISSVSGSGTVSNPTFAGTTATYSGTIPSGGFGGPATITVNGSATLSGCTGSVSSVAPISVSNFGLPQCNYVITSTSGFFTFAGGFLASGTTVFVNAFGNLGRVMQASDNAGMVCSGSNTITTPTTCCPPIGSPCPNI